MNQVTEVSTECLPVTSPQGRDGSKPKPFNFPIAIRKMEKKIVANVRTFGFHIVAIDEEYDTPEFFYTIGLYLKYGHPELLFVGVPAETAAYVFWQAKAFIEQGGSIRPWTTVPEDVAHMPLKAVPIHANNYNEFLGFGKWFYRSLGGSQPNNFPAIQLVWPDATNGLFPWEDGFEKNFLWFQKLLCDGQELKQAYERNPRFDVVS